MKLKALAIFLYFLIPLTYGQELCGTFLDHKKGLLSKECYDICTDKRGYLIVGTQYGPMKYDGEKFVPICLNLPIQERVMYDFELAPDQTFYCVSSQNKIYRIENDEAIALKNGAYATTIKTLNFLKLEWTPKGIIARAKSDEFFYDFKLQKIIQQNVSYTNKPLSEIVYNPASNFQLRITKRYYPAQYGYVSIYFKPLKLRYNTNTPLFDEARSRVIRNNSITYLLINEQLFIMDQKRVHATEFKDVLFMELLHNRLWLATKSGLYELDPSGKLLHHHFPGEVIGGITPINAKGLAVSFNQKGVFISKNINERSFFGINPTYAHSNGKHTVIGSQSGAVYTYSDNRLNYLTKVANPKKLTNSRIRKITFENGMWHICFQAGLLRYNADLTESNYLNTFIFEPSFKDFFISKGIYYSIGWGAIVNERCINKPIIQTIPVTQSSFKLNDTTIILGCLDGIYQLTTHDLRLTPYLSILKDKSISTIFVSGPFTYVASRYDGIYIFRNQQLIKHLPVPSLSVNKLIKKGDYLFIGTNEGIYQKKESQSPDKPWHKIFNGEIDNFFLIDNLLFISYQNDLITKKVTYYNSKDAIPIIVNEVLYENQTISTIPTFVKHNEPLTIDLDVLKFDADNIGLYILLKGHKNFTQTTEGTTINLGSLGSGNYELIAYPIINGKIDFNSKFTHSFRVAASFWESTVFYIMASLLLALSLFAVGLVVKLRQRKRKEERTELQQKLNEYKLLAVKAQVNPHFLSNGLAAIQALILKEKNELAAQYLAKFSLLMRRILYYSETQFISVKDELTVIDLYLELELLRFQNHFKVVRDMRLSDEQQARYLIPALLLQPIIENSIWHGVKYQQNNPTLTLSVYLSGEELVVQVKDNGHGFQQSEKNDSHFSKGNLLISERIKTLNQQFETELAFMEIESSSNGTLVTFTFKPQLYLNP